MAELSKGSSYVMKPKRRRRLGILLIGLLSQLLWVAWPLWNGWDQSEQLKKEMNSLQARGEPILPKDFASAKVADADNAALLLRAAARQIDQSTEAWKKFNWVELELPLSDEEMLLIGAGRDENPEPLSKLREARNKKDTDWQVPVKRPLMEILLPDLNAQKDLAVLGLGDLLWQHQMGNEREAVERVKDLLAQSRAVEWVPTDISHLVSLGIVESTAEKMTMMSSTLRIGDSEREVSAVEVRKLIVELLDEKSMRDGEKRAARWRRAYNLDNVRCFANDALVSPKESRGTRLAIIAVKGEILEDARLVLERWNEIVIIDDETNDWPSFERALKLKTKAMGRIEKQKEYYHLSSTMAFTDGGAVRRHWEVITARRLTAVALAIRLYEVERGRLPARLEELIPNYLPAVPRDAMAGDGSVIGYSSNAQRPVIYSVGENGTDEGGSEKPLPRVIEARFWDREDAVVHLRTQHREWKPVREPDPVGGLFPSAPQKNAVEERK